MCHRHRSCGSNELPGDIINLLPTGVRTNGMTHPIIQYHLAHGVFDMSSSTAGTVWRLYFCSDRVEHGQHWHVKCCQHCHWPPHGSEKKYCFLLPSLSEWIKLKCWLQSTYLQLEKYIYLFLPIQSHLFHHNVIIIIK